MATDFKKLAEGVSKVHKGVAGGAKGAYRISPEFRKATRSMNPGEILEAYNQAGIFGKTPKGQPIVAKMEQAPYATRTGQSSRLPSNVYVTLHPEGDLKSDPLSEMSMHMDQGLLDPRSPLTAEFVRRQGPGTGIYEIDAMSAGPGLGSLQYQLMYDLINASGDVNRALALTDVNTVRRLYNAMSHAMGRGTFGGIVPVSEWPRPASPQRFTPEGGAPGSISYSPQLFDTPSRRGNPSQLDSEQRVLADILQDRRPLVEEAISITPQDIGRMSTDEILGILAIREAQMSGTHGPSLPQTLDPADLDLLKHHAARHQHKIRASGLPSLSSASAIGANTLGRAATTEIAIRRLLGGDDPEAIARDIIQSAKDPESAFKGRYAQGGLAHAGG